MELSFYGVRVSSLVSTATHEYRGAIDVIFNRTLASTGSVACSSNVAIVLAPPDILDYPTSTDMVVREGNNVTLRCAATGTPEPTVTWRREAGGTINLSNIREGKCTIKYSMID